MIRRLPEYIVNRIAAGEVVERPASVVKELVENALDAGASRISVELIDGGKSLIAVNDDGHGLTADALPLALERHATSKLSDDQLVDIRTLGFRGEALPSIASISRLTIKSRIRGADMATMIGCVAGNLAQTQPTAGQEGTHVLVEDLFFNVPARRKFLKTDRREADLAIEVVRRLAMAAPDVAFSLVANGSERLRLESAQLDSQTRIFDLMGRDFASNAIEIDAAREGIALTGFVSLPTLSRNHGRSQFHFVNQRPVQDRLLKVSLRAAYSDVLFHDRQPLAALFLTVGPADVDVNVHPAKTEVRFREAERVRGLVIGSIKRALADHGHRTATTLSSSALGSFQVASSVALQPGLAERSNAFRSSQPLEQRLALGAPAATAAPEVAENAASADDTEYPLGAAKTLLHDNFIVSQTSEGLVLVDQHAAHERIVYERLKAQIEQNGVLRQALLVPEVVELENDEYAALMEHIDAVGALGLSVEAFGTNTVVVREVPALLSNCDVPALVRDAAADLTRVSEPLALREAVWRVLATAACHGSVRAGRRLNHDEMNSLLRAIETTPNAGQCNHGRPTYITLGLADIERLFGRRA